MSVIPLSISVHVKSIFFTSKLQILPRGAAEERPDTDNNDHNVTKDVKAASEALLHKLIADTREHCYKRGHTEAEINKKNTRRSDRQQIY